MRSARASCVGVMLPAPDCRFVVKGGSGSSSPHEHAKDLSSVEAYDPDTGQWTELPDMHIERVDGVAHLIESVPGADTFEVIVAAGYNRRKKNGIPECVTASSHGKTSRFLLPNTPNLCQPRYSAGYVVNDDRMIPGPERSPTETQGETETQENESQSQERGRTVAYSPSYRP